MSWWFLPKKGRYPKKGTPFGPGANFSGVSFLFRCQYRMKNRSIAAATSEVNAIMSLSYEKIQNKAMFKVHITLGNICGGENTAAAKKLFIL